MNDFEDSVRNALRREAAPPDFAVNVLAKVRAPKVIALPLWRRPVVWAMAAGVSLAAIVPSAALEYQRRREVQALEARRELFIALALTRTKLQQTRERIQRTTRHTL